MTTVRMTLLVIFNAAVGSAFCPGTLSVAVPHAKMTTVRIMLLVIFSTSLGGALRAESCLLVYVPRDVILK